MWRAGFPAAAPLATAATPAITSTATITAFAATANRLYR